MSDASRRAPLPVAAPEGSQRAEPLDLDALYRAHFASLSRMARALGLPDASADDLVQETFVVAVRRQESFEGRSSVKTWLTGILVRLVWNHRRKKGNDLAALPETLESATPSPEAITERRQARTLLMRLLAKLPDAQREAWVLTEMEGMTAKDAGAILGVSANTVSSRIRLARKTLERELVRERARDGGGR